MTRVTQKPFIALNPRSRPGATFLTSVTSRTSVALKKLFTIWSPKGNERPQVAQAYYKSPEQHWAWFRRRTFHVPNLTELVRLWSDTGATSDSDGVPCVELKLSSTNVRQTLSNLTPLPYQIDSDAALLPFLIHQLGSAQDPPLSSGWKTVAQKKALNSA